MGNTLINLRFTTALPNGNRVYDTRVTSVADNKMVLHIFEWWDPINKSLTTKKPSFEWLPYFYEK